MYLYLEVGSCNGFLEFHSQNLQVTSKLLTQGYNFTQSMTKHLDRSKDHTVNVVIFAWEKFRKHVNKTFHMG